MKIQSIFLMKLFYLKKYIYFKETNLAGEVERAVEI